MSHGRCQADLGSCYHDGEEAGTKGSGLRSRMSRAPTLPFKNRTGIMIHALPSVFGILHANQAPI